MSMNSSIFFYFLGTYNAKITKFEYAVALLGIICNTMVQEPNRYLLSFYALEIHAIFDIRKFLGAKISFIIFVSNFFMEFNLFYYSN